MDEQIVVNGLLTSYTKNDKGADKGVVIFLHGWASSKIVWTHATKHLDEQGIVCYTIDLPGFGKTQLLGVAWSVENYANFIKEFIVKLKLPPAVIVGHSFGGRVGIVLAAKNPELVKKLVIVDGAGIRTSSNFKKFLALASKAVKPFFRWRWTNPLRRKIYKTIGADDYVNTSELNATFVKVIGEDLSHYLPQIHQPSLIIWGKYDLVTPMNFAKQFLKHLPNGKLEVLDNAGHYSFLDKPDEFNKILINFIN